MMSIRSVMSILMLHASCLCVFLSAQYFMYVLADPPPGHNQPLGAHKEPLGVTMIGKFSNPEVFYLHFLKPGKPLHLSGVLDTAGHPGVNDWTDVYLKKHYGDQLVKVEINKKEQRDVDSEWMPYRHFLSLYLTQNLYLVHTLSKEMEDLALVPSSLQCGGVHKLLQSATLWQASGDTSSVLHNDMMDNLLCVMDGQKDVVLINKAFKEQVESHGFNTTGGYSYVDVDHVDFIKFPNLQDISWHKVSVQKGDCIFIPRGWYHQVRSSSWRHLAVNLWFSHPHWFNTSDCPDRTSTYRLLEPIQTFGFTSPNEVFRTQLLDILHDKGLMTKPVFMSVLTITTEERKEKFFKAIDKYPDQALSWSELYGFDIDKAVVKFPDIFGLPGNPVMHEDEEVILYSTDGLWEQDDDGNGDSDTETVTSTPSSLTDESLDGPDGVMGMSADGRVNPAVLLPDDAGLSDKDTEIDHVVDEMNVAESGDYNDANDFHKKDEL